MGSGLDSCRHLLWIHCLIAAVGDAARRLQLVERDGRRACRQNKIGAKEGCRELCTGGVIGSDGKTKPIPYCQHNGMGCGTLAIGRCFNPFSRALIKGQQKTKTGSNTKKRPIINL